MHWDSLRKDKVQEYQGLRVILTRLSAAQLWKAGRHSHHYGEYQNVHKCLRLKQFVLVVES